MALGVLCAAARGRRRLLRAHAHKVAAAERNAPGLGREAQGPGRARSQDPGGPAGLRAGGTTEGGQTAQDQEARLLAAAAAHRVGYFIFQRGHRAVRCPTSGAAVGVARVTGSKPARSCNTTEHQRRVVLRAAVRGPAAHGAERPAEPVLWVGRARARARVGPAVSFPSALGYLAALAKKAGAAARGTTTLHKEAPFDGRRAGRAARGADFQARAQEEDCGGGAPAAASPPSRRRQAGERLDAELDALEGALAAAEAAIACARAHGDALRVHVGCAPHEDAVCSRPDDAPRSRDRRRIIPAQAEALEVVGQLSRLVDASLARAPLELETSDEEDAPRLRIGAVVSTKWGPAVVEARRPAADPAQPRRVVCRTFWRARVICEKADIVRAPCPVSSPFGPVDLLDRVVKRADGTLLCQVRLPGARGAVLLPPCSVVYVAPVATRVWRRRRRRRRGAGDSGRADRVYARCRSTPVASPQSG